MGSDTFIALEIAERLADASGETRLPTCSVRQHQPRIRLPLHAWNDFAGREALDRSSPQHRHGTGPVGISPRCVRRTGTLRTRQFCNIAAFEIRDQASIEVGILEWWTSAPAVIEEIKGFNFASHGDEIETSLIMATGGRDYVDLSRADINSRTLAELTPEELSLYKAKIPFTRTLDKRWIGRSGNMGDPTRATAAHGDRIIQRTIEVGLELLTVLAQQLEHRHLRQIERKD